MDHRRKQRVLAGVRDGGSDGVWVDPDHEKIHGTGDSSEEDASTVRRDRQLDAREEVQGALCTLRHTIPQGRTHYFMFPRTSPSAIVH